MFRELLENKSQIGTLCLTLVIFAYWIHPILRIISKIMNSCDNWQQCPTATLPKTRRERYIPVQNGGSSVTVAGSSQWSCPISTGTGRPSSPCVSHRPEERIFFSLAYSNGNARICTLSCNLNYKRFFHFDS